MLRLLKNITFSAAFHPVSDIIKNVRTTFEISDTRLLDALRDAKTEGRMMSGTSTQSGSGEKIPFVPEHHNSISNKIPSLKLVVLCILMSSLISNLLRNDVNRKQRLKWIG